MASPPQYLLSRGLHARMRLNFQHWVMKRICGGLIHPSITMRGPASVADLGTGTAIWPIEIAEQMKATGIKSTIEGFDVSPDQYPASNVLPSNVHLHVQDAFGTFPPKYMERFDLVNIRGFVSFTRLPEAEKLLHNVSQLLRGFLQWIDLNPHQTRVVRPNNDASASPRLDQLLEGLRRPVKGEDAVFAFFPNLAELALKHRLYNVYNDSIPTSDLDQHFLNQSLMMAFEDSVMSGAKSKGLNAVAGAEVVLEKILAETGAGSYIHMELFCFVVQKV